MKTVGSLGGFLGPYAIGLLASADNDYISSMVLLASCLVAGGMLCVAFPEGQGTSRCCIQMDVAHLRASQPCWQACWW